MPERQYFIRGNPVTVEEIPAVVGVKLELSADERVAERQREAALDALGGEVSVAMSEIERNAFFRAGWVFVRPPARGMMGLPAGVQASHIGRVFRRPRGRILIGTDRLAVKLHPGLSPAEAMRLLVEGGLEVVRQVRFAPNSYEVAVPAERDFLDVALQLHERNEFVYAEPEMIQHVGQRSWKPTKDPRYKFQWQWHPLRSTGADIGAEIAWGYTRGSGVRIAVIDTGFDVSHPDLKAAIGNRSGYFEDRSGTDPVFVPGLNGFPDDSHGTFCAGMAAARANNREGGVGIANRAELMLVACLDYAAVGTQATLARAVAYAADPANENSRANSQDGATVISCSVGPDDGDWDLESLLEDALNFAVTKGRGGLGTPIFWAVGNDYHPVATDPVASHAAVIAVGCSTQSDEAGTSAFGPGLEFLAPGVGVYSTTSGGQYDYNTGTSYAAPCAAGIAALVLARHPGWTWQQARQKIRDTCDKVGGVTYGSDGRHQHYGYGRVNAGKAVP